MKRLLSLPLFLLFYLFSIGQSIKHVSLDFNKDSFQVQQDNAGKVIIASNSLEYFLQSDTLLPALPYIGYNVLISSTEKYDSHLCSDSKYLFRSNVIMA